MDDNEVLDAIQAGELLQLNPKTIYKLAEKGTIPAKRIGRSWRFKRSQLLKFLDAPSQKDDTIPAIAQNG